ncbi:autophagy-related protein 13-domain-containing protein [Cladochytrium replicatum]|nr:autophagy-related protein 13-domain-containing protein [Cladochytrium replicatum]
MSDQNFTQPSSGAVWPPVYSISSHPRSYDDSPLSTSTRSISSGAGPMFSPALPNASLPRSGPSSTTSINRTEQVIQNFYSKCAQVIIQARWSHPYSGSSTPDSRRTSLTGQKKTNKWFNLEMEDIEPVKEELRYWRSNAVNSPQPPPLTIDLFLDIGELDHEKVSLMVKDEQSRRQRVTPDLLRFIDPNTGEEGLKRAILLETWQLTLSHPVPSNPPDLPVIYKKSAMFFRSLYSFILP